MRLSAEEAQEYTKIKQWIPFADKIYELEKIRRRGKQLEAEKVATEWSAITTDIKAMQVKLKDDKNINLESIYTAGEVLDDLKKSLGSIYDFYNGYDPMFTWWVPKPYQALDESLTGLRTLHFKNKALNHAARN